MKIMSTLPTETSAIKYAKTHEWVRIDADTQIATVGVSVHAQAELGELVYVELPEIGKNIKQGEEVAVIESVKSAADVYAPVTGCIVEINEVLEAHPSKVNEDACGEGWIYRCQLDTLLAEPEIKMLMSFEQYNERY